jgi:hypothetical protein
MRLGVGWYSPDQWSMLKAFAADSEKLDADYEAWLDQAEKNISVLKQQPHMEVVKIPVQVRELMAWCQERGLHCDAAARAQYLAERTVAGAGYAA